MCKSVLNDEWISRPTFASEDSGFVAHKKNIYEEALHRSEEERHEYDFHIEAIVKTIGLLDPINNKIAQLNPEERGHFKLKPNFGGAGKSIHHRVIRKIYGRDNGEEIIRAMQDSPALSIPVVLTRLKQKEEEWKRAQREWNKVWREVDARNYYKSLDHQGITFKAIDKKAITIKAFVSQIEAARAEQVAKRASYIDPLFGRTRACHQLEFTVDNISVLQDSLKLIFSFLDRTSGQLSQGERKRVEGFLRTFIPMFFMLDPPSFNAAFSTFQELGDSEMSDEVASGAEDEGSSVAGSSRAGRGGRKSATNGNAGDLRKKLLKSGQAKWKNRSARSQGQASPSISRAQSPEDDSNQRVEGRTPRRSTFHCNTAFYVLLRLLEVSRYIRHISISNRRLTHFSSSILACCCSRI
jgi:paired amphipathic helix protein Sin3a